MKGAPMQWGKWVSLPFLSEHPSSFDPSINSALKDKILDSALALGARVSVQLSEFISYLRLTAQFPCL